MGEKLFESTTEGIIRYFVRPNDEYVLNSLEKIDADEYLYRVLKNEGYQRIVFVGIEKTNCQFYAYDKLSHLSLLHQDEFANVAIESLESITGFFSRVKAKIDKNDAGLSGITGSAKSESTFDKIPEFGKREVKSFAELIQFVSYFTDYVSKALEAFNIKTAIVVQMEVFEQSFKKEALNARKFAAQLGDIIRYCEKNNSTMQNILVLTTTQKENFRDLVNNELMHNFHPWVHEILSETTSNSMLVRNIIDRLNEYGCLVVSESIGVDEIANLLLRKKIVEKDAAFDNLQFSKIYPLAEKIRIHLTYESKVFSDNFPFVQRRSYIKPLNTLLSRKKVAEELIACSGKLEAKAINNVNTKSIEVFRVYHKSRKYIDIDDSAEILSEFDKLDGVEIQEAKRDALRAVNYFEGMKKELEEKEQRGKKVSADDFPYLNMLFFGAPGTGKTTIANLVGKLMHAKGVLPVSKVYPIQASELGSGTVHGVQDKLLEEAENAVGGVLLIDELQALEEAYQGGNLAKDFMKGIVSISNKYRGKLSIILCGYEEEVLRIIKFDKGADRRFPQKIKLNSYSVDTLMTIMHKLLEADGKTLGDGVEEKIRKIIVSDMNVKGETFGNVGYLKDELIGPIKAAYFERGQYDNIYTMQDLETAFSRTAESNPENHYKRISKSFFEKLDVPLSFQKYNEEIISETQRRDLIRSSILFVSTDKGSGTAFLISPNGYAITCNHVIAGAKEIKARLRIAGRIGGDDSEHICTVINARTDTDMALLKLKGKNFPYLPISDEKREILDGETFTLSGYPLGKSEDLTSYTGYIANQNGMTDLTGKKYLYIEGEAKKGNSGSPLVSTRDGKVIGILFGSDADGLDEMNKMRPIKYFWEEFLE